MSAGTWSAGGSARIRQKPARKQSLREVEVDGLVILKIVKHCREFASQVVTGQLLGLDDGGILEVTNCFALPAGGDDEQQTATFQREMMVRLREVNVDCMTVGWYQSAHMGQFQSASVIQSQFNYQSQIRNSAMIVYDPERSTPQGMALKAYRLTDTFMEMYKKGQKFATKNGELPASSVFEELPVKVKNSYMIAGLLTQLEKESGGVTPDFSGVEQATDTSYVEQSIERLAATVDDLTEEQRRFQMWQRDVSRMQAQQAALLQKLAAEGKQIDPAQQKAIPEPSRLQSLMIANQIDSTCDQISQIAAQGMSRSFLLRGLATDQ